MLYIEGLENHEDSDLEGCDVVLLGEWFIFGEALDSLTLNMKVILHMSGTTHLIQRHIREDLIPQHWCCGNFKSHIKIVKGLAWQNSVSFLVL